MARGFGEFYKLRGIITYRLSPFELRAFRGTFTKGFPNMLRRMREEFLYVVPPFALTWLAYEQIQKRHDRLMRKNPADYENDE